MSIFSKLLYYLTQLIPFWLVHLCASILAFLLQYVVKYRVAVVRQNLKNAFPSYTNAALKEIEKKFYLNFCDVLLENLKLNSISKKTVRKRMKFLNPEVFSDLAETGKGAMLIGAHYNNWEWMALSLSTYLNEKMFSVYKPLNNKLSDRLMLNARARFGANIIPMQQFPKVVLKNKNRGAVHLMIADQSPHRSKLDFFCSFLNQDTPVYLGAEKLMKAANLNLYFVEVHRVKRGFYEMKIVPLNEQSTNEKGQATKMHLSHLEKMIINSPESWLWSHRRWKHSQKK
ncbi:MAG: lysophospholipid acyltransferase family protein [Flavobacteriales bacterium]|nr:lysophospholipid acyltransferase family protein [Flavobacteriales bacterium]